MSLNFQQLSETGSLELQNSIWKDQIMIFQIAVKQKTPAVIILNTYHRRIKRALKIWRPSASLDRSCLIATKFRILKTFLPDKIVVPQG